MNPHSAEEDSTAGKKSKLFKLTKSHEIQQQQSRFLHADFSENWQASSLSPVLDG